MVDCGNGVLIYHLSHGYAHTMRQLQPEGISYFIHFQITTLKSDLFKASSDGHVAHLVCVQVYLETKLGS